MFGIPGEESPHARRSLIDYSENTRVLIEELRNRVPELEPV